MKIGMISDLHVDVNDTILKKGESFAQLVAEKANNEKVDFLLIAGDNSSEAGLSKQINKKIQALVTAKVLFVPGNHDLWSRENGVTDTFSLYKDFLKQPESIIGQPVILSDEWAIVGATGWYDYGYANHKEYTLEKFEEKKYRFAYWNDAHYIHWDKSDQEVSAAMLEQLERDLQSVGDRKVFLMTHMATHGEFVVPLPNKMYDYFNAFLGSKSYEQLYDRYPIKYSNIGHVHMRKIIKEEDTVFISACLGNKKHWTIKDAKTEIDRTFVTIDL